MLNLRQKELHEWQVRNFGKHEDDIDAMFTGMCEEFGELSHAKLKYRQGIREYVINESEVKSGIENKLKNNLSDSFGDLMIYSCQLMTELGIDGNNICETKPFITNFKDNYKTIATSIGYIGQLLELEYDEEIKRELSEEFTNIYYYGKKFLAQYDINADDAINTTIDTVLKRNWKENPSGMNIDTGDTNGK